jgi:uncharacterized repeat protein (TIGR03803 family)
MKRNKPWLGPLVLAVALSLPLTSSALGASKEILLHTFTGVSGAGPDALVFDRAGNLYGTTLWGGVQNCSPQPGCGTIFKLTRTRKGWRYKLIYSFQGGFDGANPSRGLYFDRAGNLYGTTIWGGPANGGTVFKLTRSEAGWTETVIHSFGEGSDAANPRGGLTFDAAGNLYGTAWNGGAHGAGAVYKLNHLRTGWNESVLYNFGASGQDGALPVGRVIFDSSGNLYGATQLGGSAGLGTVFKLSRSGRVWAETVLHSFTGGADADWPEDGLILDTAGNLYGTSVYGGGGNCQFGCGTVFQLSPTSGGGWTTSVIHAFLGKDGSNPFYALSFDSAGDLYSTATDGGAYGGGTVFKLTLLSGGHWKESVIHSFTGGRDGAQPQAAVIFDATGNLYSCTLDGGIVKGKTGNGVAFEIPAIALDFTH